MSALTKEVEPVNRVEANGNEYEYRYTFGEVHVDEVECEEFDRAELHHHDGYIVWDYPGKPNVKIQPDGAYVYGDVPTRKGEQQAYYALSVLNDGCGDLSQSYVSNWREL